MSVLSMEFLFPVRVSMVLTIVQIFTTLISPICQSAMTIGRMNKRRICQTWSTMREGLKENIVASVVDVGSILLAFNLGLHQMDQWIGLAYGATDAWVVIWQRQRITRWISRLGQTLRGRLTNEDRLHIGSILWDIEPSVSPSLSNP